MTRQEIFAWAENEYGTEPEYLWLSDPEFAVLRSNSGKWYGIIMNVPRCKLGLKGSEEIDILNVKADPVLIELLAGDSGFLRAYHMSKTKWITILLDGSVPAETIKNMLSESHRLTDIKRKRKSKCSDQSEE